MPVKRFPKRKKTPAQIVKAKQSKEKQEKKFKVFSRRTKKVVKFIAKPFKALSSKLSKKLDKIAIQVRKDREIEKTPQIGRELTRRERIIKKDLEQKKKFEASQRRLARRKDFEKQVGRKATKEEKKIFREQKGSEIGLLDSPPKRKLLGRIFKRKKK